MKIYTRNRSGFILILAVFFSGPAACDLLSNEPKKVDFLDNAFSVVMPAHWSVRDDLNDEADLQMGNSLKEAYAIILSESKMDFDNLSMEERSDITRSMIAESLSNYQESKPEYLDNGDIRTLRYRLEGTIDGINVVYWHVTLETADHFHQMLLWSLKSKFAKNEDDYSALIGSFAVN